jgi:hypothetical protein
MAHSRFGWMSITPGCLRRGSMPSAGSWRRTIDKCATCINILSDSRLAWMRKIRPNEAVRRIGVSRFAQRQTQRHRRLAPIADLCVKWSMHPSGLAWWWFRRQRLPGARAIRDGTSRQEARRILGEPTQIWRDDEADDPYEAWEYACGVFRDERVVFTLCFYSSGRSVAHWSFSLMRAAQPDTSPNGGPATRIGDSGASGRPPSVS